jgi:hypothetical protein
MNGANAAGWATRGWIGVTYAPCGMLLTYTGGCDGMCPLGTAWKEVYMYAGAASPLDLRAAAPFDFGTPLVVVLRAVLLQARHVKSTADQSRFGLPACSSARSWHVVLYHSPISTSMEHMAGATH